MADNDNKNIVEPEILNEEPEVRGIEKSTVERVMEDSFLKYSMSVIIDRALPDVRDGLKPVNRRILYAMNKNGWRAPHATVKSAKIVGEVMGNYHPHGDSSIYDAMVNLAQPWKMRYTLVEGQGNFGSSQRPLVILRREWIKLAASCCLTSTKKLLIFVITSTEQRKSQ